MKDFTTMLSEIEKNLIRIEFSRLSKPDFEPAMRKPANRNKARPIKYQKLSDFRYG